MSGVRLQRRTMRKLSRLPNVKIALLLAFVVTVAQSQTTPSVQQKSEKSTCSNIVALAGDVKINAQI